MSADRKARVAGFLYPICIVSGFCAEALVRNKLVVYDDAALTARNIIASPSLYRLGFCRPSFIHYGHRDRVSRPVALAALAFAIVSNTASIAATIF